MPKFDPIKLKVNLKLALTRLQLQRNKKANQIENSKRDIANLLVKGTDESARIRVESVIREDLLIEAYEILELFIELLLARLDILTVARGPCPPDMKEAVCTLIFAAPRCEGVTELRIVRDQLIFRYGKEIDKEAMSNCGGCINARVLHKLSVHTPETFLVYQYLNEIAKAHSVDWHAEISPDSVPLDMGFNPSISPAAHLPDGPRNPFPQQPGPGFGGFGQDSGPSFNNNAPPPNWGFPGNNGGGFPPSSPGGGGGPAPGFANPFPASPKQGSFQGSGQNGFPPSGGQPSFPQAPGPSQFQNSFPQAPNQNGFPQTPNQNQFPQAPSGGKSSFPQSPNQNPFPQAPSQNSFPQAPSQNSFPQAPNQNPFPQAPSQSPFPQAPNQNPFPQAPNQNPFPQAPNQNPFPQSPNQNKGGSGSMFPQAPSGPPAGSFPNAPSGNSSPDFNFPAIPGQPQNKPNFPPSGFDGGNGGGNGGDDIPDFDELTKRFEAIKRRNQQ